LRRILARLPDRDASWVLMPLLIHQHNPANRATEHPEPYEAVPARST
jgi:hypothetical protein